MLHTEINAIRQTFCPNSRNVRAMFVKDGRSTWGGIDLNVGQIESGLCGASSTVYGIFVSG